MRRQRLPKPPAPAPAKPRHGAHETTITWVCCGVVFEQTPALIEHLRLQHGLTTFKGTASVQMALDGEGFGVMVYECNIGGVTVLKTVKTTTGGAL